MVQVVAVPKKQNASLFRISGYVSLGLLAVPLS